uniref:Uncharacterized protein n=1 Tax=viral metagenome TaxID=1070528 RepID=A0A6C0JZY3_9ZZZZ
MLIFVYLIIVLFTINILYMIVKKYLSFQEGVTGSSDTTAYQDPNLSQNPLYLATINASNIAYLKSKLDDIDTIRTTVDALNEQVESNSTAIQGINTSMQITSSNAIPDQSTTQSLANTGNADANVST